jgi:hypothetical protein
MIPLDSKTSQWNTAVRTQDESNLLLACQRVSLAFTSILWPFFGAILWAAVLDRIFPFLIGQRHRLPNYLVLISTLNGQSS